MSRGTAEVADRLHSAAIHLLRRMGRTDPLTGVSPAQLSALSVLMGGPRRLSELAAAQQVRPPTMTRLVQGMERAGLVRREADPADARVVRIRWTPKGERVLRHGRELRLTQLDARLRRLPAAEIALLDRAVAIVERVVREWSTTADAPRDRERKTAR